MFEKIIASNLNLQKQKFYVIIQQVYGQSSYLGFFMFLLL